MLAWIPGGRMKEISIIQNSNSGDRPVLGHTPKPGGAMEGLRLPEVLYGDYVGHRTGDSRDSGRGLARLLRKPYLNSHS